MKNQMLFKKRICANEIQTADQIIHVGGTRRGPPRRICPSLHTGQAS